MKIIIFDVNNAACSIVVCPNRYALMIDCGSHSEKPCPALQVTSTFRDWLNIQTFTTRNRVNYQIALLHITHPDDDHVKNADEVMSLCPPYLLQRIRWEEFPSDEKIHEDYKEKIDNHYRGQNPEPIPWGFAQSKTFSIPVASVKQDNELSKKVKNNSSILKFLEYGGVKVLFGGDLEKAGWEWLVNNDLGFVNTMKNGLDILIAPHHGHRSGFPSALFDLTGNVKVAVLSKASESESADSNVSSQYSQKADGIAYTSLNDKHKYFASGTLTTRSNGTIFFEVKSNGEISTYTEKASSNHQRL